MPVMMAEGENRTQIFIDLGLTLCFTNNNSYYTKLLHINILIMGQGEIVAYNTDRIWV